MPQKPEDEIKISDYTCLKLICWNRPDEGTLSRADAFAIYQRYFRFIADMEMDEHERALFEDLIKNEGGGEFSYIL